MLKYQIYQSKLEGSTAYGKYYARIVSDETINLASLAEHMVSHNCPFSKGTILGILEDTVNCTRELLLKGNRVQLDNLASFGLSVEHSMGAPSAEEFSVRKNVKSIKLIAQGIGEFQKSILTSNSSLAESTTYVSPKSPLAAAGTESSDSTAGEENGHL